ncbi:MAG: hypothetical protein AB2L11_08515 [Syntrophobacteraceae bacterium]
MKSAALAIILVGAVGLLVYTNPTMEDFGNYARQYAIQELELESQDPIGRFFGSILGGIAGGMASSQAIRTDYVILSTYELQMGKERLRALGIFRNFILLEKPDLKRHKTKDKSGK